MFLTMRMGTRVGASSPTRGAGVGVERVVPAHRIPGGRASTRKARWRLTEKVPPALYRPTSVLPGRVSRSGTLGPRERRRDTTGRGASLRAGRGGGRPGALGEAGDQGGYRVEPG